MKLSERLKKATKLSEAKIAINRISKSGNLADCPCIYGTSKYYPTGIIFHDGGDMFRLVQIKANKIQTSTTIEHRRSGFSSVFDFAEDFIKYLKEKSLMKLDTTWMGSKDFLKKCVSDFVITPRVLDVAFPNLKTTFVDLSRTLGDTHAIEFNDWKIIGSDKDASAIEPTLSQAEKVLSSFHSKLAKVCYGQVIMTPSMGKVLADYNIMNDTMRVSSTARKSNEFLKTLIHELGHRIWYRVLDEKARSIVKAKYNDTVHGDRLGGSSAGIKEGAKFTHVKFGVIEIVSLEFGKNGLKPVYKVPSGDKYIASSKADLLRQLVDVEGVEKDPFNVSKYALTTAEEFFSEIVSFGLVDNIKEIKDFIKELL